MSGPRLECVGLAGGHARVTVVRGVDLTAAAGTVVAIVGPNGAGKTTLLTTIAGLLPSHAGAVRVDGTMVKRGRADAAGRAGIVLVPDDRSLFSTLTVRENVEAAMPRRGDPRTVLDLFPALEPRWSVAAGALSGGEQQMLAIARAMVQQPRVLLIDEMSMGLAPVIVEDLLPIVRRVADDTAAAVVLVEQHVGLALEVADDAVLLVHGEVVLRGAASELRADPARLEAAYLGNELTEEPGGKAVSQT